MKKFAAAAAELQRLHHWEKPATFETSLDVDFSTKDHWTSVYGIIRKSFALKAIIVLHFLAMIAAAASPAWLLAALDGGSRAITGLSITLYATVLVLLHQFFYGLSSSHADDIANGRGFSTDTILRAFRVFPALIPFSLTPGFTIGGLLRPFLPLRMVFGRNTELLFIGRYTHYMLAFVFTRKGGQGLPERLLDAAKLSVERRHDVFDVLEGERKRYFIGILALIAVAALRDTSLVSVGYTLLMVFLGVSFCCSHVGMIWMPTIWANYQAHGGETETLPEAKASANWIGMITLRTLPTLMAGLAVTGGIVFLAVILEQTARQDELHKAAVAETLSRYPLPTDRYIGRWKRGFADDDKDDRFVKEISRLPEVKCKRVGGRIDCVDFPHNWRGCYRTGEYEQTGCFYAPREDDWAKQSVASGDALVDREWAAGRREFLDRMADNGFEVGDVEYILLDVSRFPHHSNTFPEALDSIEKSMLETAWPTFHEQEYFVHFREGSRSAIKAGADIEFFLGKARRIRRVGQD